MFSVLVQVVIGHDWGSFTASRFALWYPERLLALAMYAFHSISMDRDSTGRRRLSVPYTPPLTHHMSVHERAQRYPSFGYQVYFASEESTAEIEAHVRINPFELFASIHTF